MKSSFDAETARKTGTIIPSAGVNENYDEAIENIKKTESEINKYLKEQSKAFSSVSQVFKLILFYFDDELIDGFSFTLSH